jgi:alanine racemase
VGRRLTNNGEVLVRDVRLPLVGTVAMDSVTLDVGSPPSVTVGARAVLIGSQGDERVTAEEGRDGSARSNAEVTCRTPPSCQPTRRLGVTGSRRLPVRFVSLSRTVPSP